MDSVKKIHPIIRNNYGPRFIASSFYLAFVVSVWKEGLLTWKFSWIIALALSWPHLARFFAMKAKNGKRQEIINMHLDAFFSGMVFIAAPALNFATTVMVILITNGLFIGAFRLVASMLAAFSASFLPLFFIVQPPMFLETGLVSSLCISAFFLLYYSAFALMAYYMTRKLIRLNKEVKTLSVKDPLTKCYNRLYLDGNLTKELHRCYRMQYPLTLIFADLDHFKKINDQYGHGAGDHILKQFVATTESCIREDVDWIARFGGEEFVIVLPNSNASGGYAVAERIREKVNQQKFLVGEEEIEVTCSFGVSSIRLGGDETEAEALLAQADSGLYRAKAKGRNRVELADLAQLELPQKAG